MQESHKDPKDPQQKKEVKLPHLIVPEYPEDVFVIPCFGKPVMPSQIVPMQISLDFEDTILKIAENNNDKVFAIFSLGDKPVQGRDITPDDYPKTGTLARLLHAKSVPGELQIIVEGICRIELKSWNTKSKLPLATIAFPETVFPEADSKEEIEVRSYAMSLVGAIQELLPLNPMYSDEMRQYLLRFNQNDPSLLADCAASISSADVQALQQILDTEDILEAFKVYHAYP